ncbi:MAG: hypothetical protein AAGU78_14850 [Chloroflexota bacterium]|nr:hypothetical protein [Aggregatilineaceae bacterium]
MTKQEWDAVNYRGQIHQNGLLELVVDGEFSPQLTQQLLHFVEQMAHESGPLTGLMLDLRCSTSVSIVRASNLVEALSRIVTPMAVVFIWNQQHQIASLIHHTLARRDAIAYFTNPTDAWNYLLRRVRV